MIVERYSHVMHIVSNVTGTLQQGKNAFDVLAATFRQERLAVRQKYAPWKLLMNWNRKTRRLFRRGRLYRLVRQSGYRNCH